VSGILLVVFATAILNNLILYFWKPCLLCELEDSMIQLKSLSIEPLRDPKEFQLAADRRPALKLLTKTRWSNDSVRHERSFQSDFKLFLDRAARSLC
jgi:hypothetical protein